MSYLSKEERDRLVAAGVIAYPDPMTGMARALPGKSRLPKPVPVSPPPAFAVPATPVETGAPVVRGPDNADPYPTDAAVEIDKLLDGLAAAIETDRDKTIALFGETSSVPAGLRLGYDNAASIVRAAKL